MARLNGKVAAVIGGASGIDEATARRFVMEGAKEAAAFVRQAAQRVARRTDRRSAAFRDSEPKYAESRGRGLDHFRSRRIRGGRRAV